MELKPGSNIPSYHVLFGQKVTLRYPGQKQTCARCFKSSEFCMGGGIARKCEAAGGQRVDFSDFILDMWQKIGYSPQEIEVATLYDDHGDLEVGALMSPPSQQTGGAFTPPKVQTQEKMFTGIMIKNIPRESDVGEIVEFLVQNGLPQSLSDNIEIKENGKVYVNSLANSLCLL